MVKKIMNSVEIYPHIVVYKNLFKDIDKVYDILKKSEDVNNQKSLFQWDKWSDFGRYHRTPRVVADQHSLELKILKNYETTNEVQVEEEKLIIEVMNNIYLANNDYIKKYNILIDPNEEILINNIPVKLWRWQYPNFCVYDPTVEYYKKAMTYHSDYVVEPIKTPGYKFVITTLAYFNDDYGDGGLDFAVGNKLISYKPEAGDIVVFPSGHPDYLTENGMVYLHAVEPIRNNKKYFCRSYWLKYYDGGPEWYQSENQYGKEKWKEMYSEIYKKFTIDNPQRAEIKNGVRLR